MSLGVFVVNVKRKKPWKHKKEPAVPCYPCARGLPARDPESGESTGSNPVKCISFYPEPEKAIDELK